MTDVTLLLLAAAAAFGLAKLVRLPVIPLLMLSGAGLRAAATAYDIEIPEALLREMIEIGLAVLVFAAGVELSPRRMAGRTRPILIVAVLQFFSLGAAGIGAAFLLGYDLTSAFYLGCALSASSTLVVVRHLQQRRQMFEPYGRFVLGVLLLQDVFIILLLVALLRLPDGPAAGLLDIGKALGLGLIALALHKWAVPFITRKMRLDDEELMLGALSMLFAFSGIAHLLGLPFLVGAFLAGFVLSAFPMNGLVRGMLGSLSGFFLALFFIGVGAALTIPDTGLLLHAVIFIVVLIAVTVPLVSIVAELTGYSTRASIEGGLLLSQTSEFSLLLALAGVASGQIGQDLFTLIALITVSTMTLTPFLAREPTAWALMKIHPRYRRGEFLAINLTDHAVLLGYGRAGHRTLELLREHGLEVVVVDDDAAVIRELIAHNIPCIQGDGSDPRILEQANAHHARVVLCSMRRTRDAQSALQHLRHSRPKVLVRTFEQDETDLVQSLGGIPVKSAEASADSFIKWLDLNPELGSNRPT